MKLAIIGCGRSGTKFMARHLSQKWTVGHETEQKNGTVDWHATVRDLTDYLVLHQVRHPLDTIASCHTILPNSWKYIAEHTDIRLDTPLLLRCMQYWVLWNRMAEAKAILTYRVENIVSSVSPTTNSRNHLRLNWPDLHQNDKVWAIRVQTLAHRYGY